LTISKRRYANLRQALVLERKKSSDKQEGALRKRALPLRITRKQIENSFVCRIAHCLGYATLRELANDASITYAEINAMAGKRRGLTEDMDHSEAYQSIAELVNRKFAEVFAAREELQRKLNLDRIRRLQRREKIQCR
jgi:hypothetical protein